MLPFSTPVAGFIYLVIFFFFFHATLRNSKSCSQEKNSYFLDIVGYSGSFGLSVKGVCVIVVRVSICICAASSCNWIHNVVGSLYVVKMSHKSHFIAISHISSLFTELLSMGIFTSPRLSASFCDTALKRCFSSQFNAQKQKCVITATTCELGNSSLESFAILERSKKSAHFLCDFLGSAAKMCVSFSFSIPFLFCFVSLCGSVTIHLKVKLPKCKKYGLLAGI